MIVLIDNYDSFVHNLGRHMGLLGWRREVVRNDSLSAQDIADMNPSAVVISPGPCTPAESGVSMEFIRRFGHIVPILGVCLGHQCIGEVYGGRTRRALRPVHGKADLLDHTGRGLFLGLPSPLRVGRYHSLVTDLPANSDLLITATSAQNEIMAVRHVRYPVYGVQFHPESILTDHGLDILRNFSNLATQWNERDRALAHYVPAAPVSAPAPVRVHSTAYAA